MTGAEIKTMADSIVDDTIDDTLFYQLLNAAKNRREEERPWEMLKKLDSSKTAAFGDTYQSAKALPSDWRYTYRMMVGTDIEYIGVLFEEQHIYRNSPNRFFVDVANGNFFLTGIVNAAKTIYHFYIKSTDDVAAGTSPVWPARFHPLLAFDVAALFQGGIDYDDVNARMSPENKAAAKLLHDSMIAWDTNLKLKAMNHNYSGGGESALPLSTM